MSPYTMTLLYRNETFNNLIVLKISKCKIGSIGAKLVTKMNIPNLGKIELSYCNIESTGIKHLTKGAWPNLTELILFKNNIKIDGFEAFGTMTNWKKICQNFSKLFITIQFKELITYQSLTTMNLPNGRFYQVTRNSREILHSSIHSIFTKKFIRQ